MPSQAHPASWHMPAFEGRLGFTMGDDNPGLMWCATGGRRKADSPGEPRVCVWPRHRGVHRRSSRLGPDRAAGESHRGIPETPVETPFSRPGRFWRGNLHTHSTLSDGHRSPEEVCRFYETAGYDFLALTEHFQERYGWPLVDTRPFRSATFTTIIGAELHSAQDRMELGAPWHILAVGLPLDFAPS